MSTGNPEACKRWNAERSSDEARANGIKGGIKSGETRRRQKTLREAVQAFYNAPADPEVAARLEALGLDGTMRSALTEALARRALEKGDPEAYKTLRDTAGEAPSQVHEVKLDGAVNLREMDTETLVALAEGAEVAK